MKNQKIYLYDGRQRGFSALDSFKMFVTKVRDSTVPGQWICKPVYRLTIEKIHYSPNVKVLGFEFPDPFGWKSEVMYMDERAKNYGWIHGLGDEVELETKRLSESSTEELNKHKKQCDEALKLPNLRLGFLSSEPYNPTWQIKQ